MTDTAADTQPTTGSPSKPWNERLVEIEMTNGRSGRLTLDGHDVSDQVAGFSMEWFGSARNSAPTLLLHTVPFPTKFTGRALVELAPVRDDPALPPVERPDYYGVILDWLGGMDPEDLSRRALNAGAMGQDPIAAVIDVLKAEAQKARDEERAG